MKLFSNDLWSQNASLKTSSSSMKEQWIWIETRGRAGEKKRSWGEEGKLKG